MNQISNNKKEIALNFLPLNKIEFEYTIWCRIASNGEKKWSEDIKKYSLQDENNLNIYSEYWVSFNRFEQSNKRKISSLINLHLTNYYLFTLLVNKLSEGKLSFEQKDNEKNFAPYHIYILTEATQWGHKAIRFEPYYLKAKGKFGFLVDYKFLKKDGIPFDRKIQLLSFSLDDDFKSNTSYHIDKFNYITNFIKNNFHNFSKLNNEIEILSIFEKLVSNQLNSKTYIFHGDNKDESPFQGMIKYGPYSLKYNDFKYIYIYHKEHKSYVNSLIEALNGKTFNTFKGLDKFGLPKQTKENIKGIAINSFKTDFNNILDQLDINEKVFIICVFPSKEREFYFALKNFCLQKDIPLQTVHLETIIDDKKLKWSISGIALQILAKVGNIPWIVDAKNRDCVIIGIGQAIEKDSKNTPIRFFSYSIVLDSSGQFLTIEPLSDANTKDGYIFSLAEKIPLLIKQYQNYRKIVFHIPEKISLNAIKAIEAKIKKLTFNVDLYIIRINNESKFFGYDMNNNSLIPYESSYIQLSKKEFLLWTEGLNFNNPTPQKRYSNPIYVDFYYSNQEKIDYWAFLQDILNLSGTNYRGFKSKSIPVSMYYPKLISNFYKNFKRYNLQTKIEKRDNMWFL